jgi:hypothetical protein
MRHPESTVQPSAPATAASEQSAVLRVLSSHALGIAAAILLAVVLVAPRWWLLWTDPDEGVRTQVNPGGAFGIGQDESSYVPGMREAFEGRLPVIDPYLVDHQDGPPQTFAWWSEAIGVFAHVTGGDIFYAFAIVATVAAVATFLLLYALAFRITRSQIGAVAVMFIAVMYVEILQQANGSYLRVRNSDVIETIVRLDPPGEFHVWYRYLAPAMPLPIFFGALLLLWKAHETRAWAWIVAAGAAVALLVYTNPFYWTALALAAGLWCAWNLYRRDVPAILTVVKVGVVAVVLAAPELVILAWSAADVPAEVTERSGLDDFGINTGLRTIIVQRLLVGLPFAYFAWRGPEWNRFWMALYAAPLLLAVPRGHVPQEDHYLYQAAPAFSIPLFAAGTVEFLRWLDDRYARVAVATIGALAVAGALHFPAFQARAIESLDQDYALRPDEAAAFEWLRDNARDDATVVTPSRSTNWYIVSLTPAYVYVPYGSGAVGSRAGNEEIIDRYLRASAAFGYTTEAAIGRLDPSNSIPVRTATTCPRPKLSHMSNGRCSTTC